MKNVWNSFYVVVGIILLFACGLAYESFYHLWRGSLAYSIVPQDDFYYYYLTAKNVALHGFSSFDGIVPTNGYHPLWLWCLSVLVWISRGNNHLFFELLQVIQILSSGISAYLLWSLYKSIYGNSSWIAPLSLIASLLLTVLIFSGMETAVAVPFYLLFLLMLQKHRVSFMTGIVASLLVLSRLDSIIAVGIAFILFILRKEDWKNILFFLLGLLPIGMYLLYNHFAFGNWEPVSAQAKQMGTGLHFSYRAIEAIGTPRGFLYFFLTVIGFVLSVKKKNFVRIILYGFPVLLTVILAFRLSWSSYYWYYYPFVISALAALLDIRERLPNNLEVSIDRLAPIASIAILLIAAFVLQRDIIGLTSKLNLVASETRAQPNIFIHALGIKPFTDTHPGRYAMGDRAGLTAYITGKPILQMEGLAADQAMVDSIAHCANLLNVLRSYGVQYYIVSYPLREFHEKDWRWDLYEPHSQQIEPWAPALHGSFYAPEVFRFPTPVDARLTHTDSASLWVTRILDITNAHE